MSPSTPSLKPSGIANLLSRTGGVPKLSSWATFEQRSAAARAILRYTLHTKGNFDVRRVKGLHPSYLDLHGAQAGQESENGPEDIAKMLKDFRSDLFDAAIALDRLDGGISLILRCPGFNLPDSSDTDDITVDVLFSPRELTEGGQELSKFLAMTIQSFGHECALPYLRRYMRRCAIEGVAPLNAPEPGKPLGVAGPSYIPDTHQTGNGAYFRCRCRKGSRSDLAQHISLDAMSIQPFPGLSQQRNLNPLVNKTSQCVTLSSPRVDVPETDRPAFSGVLPAYNRVPEVRASPAHITIPPPPNSADRERMSDTYEVAVIVSLGPNTDAVIDSYRLPDAAIIPKLRAMSQTLRSSSWVWALQEHPFNFGYAQAQRFSLAMHKDFGLLDQSSDDSTFSTRYRLGCVHISAVILLLAFILVLI